LDALYVVAAILLFDGKENEETFEMMQQEDVFPRLVELIQDWGNGRSPSLQRLLLIVMYEMARIQRLGWDDLCTFLPVRFLNKLLTRTQRL
jgi:hypothetical protein